MDWQEFVRGLTVRVLLRRKGEEIFAGTGFLVGKGVVLTCSHVLMDREDADLVVNWSGKDWPCTVEQELPAPFPSDSDLETGWPDLAELRCGASNRDVLLLDPGGAAGPGSEVFFLGYSSEADGGIVAGHPVGCAVDGEVDVQPNRRLLKLNTDRVLKGQSGCAIVANATGLVVAVAKQRLSGQPHASYGIPAATVFDALPELASAQREYRQTAAAPDGQEPLLTLPAPNPFFFARPTESHQLASALRDAGVVALLGSAGVGKSALAREYVLDSRSRYVETLWLDARDEATVRCRLAEVAQRLDLPPQTGSLETLAAAVYIALGRAADHWLLVLDGLENVTLGRKLMPGEGPGVRVLITSRLNDLRLLGARTNVRLTTLDPGAAAMLVLSRLGGNSEQTPDVQAIVGATNNRPGELEQAAAAALQEKAKTGQWVKEPPEFRQRVEAALAAQPGGALLRLLAVLADAPFPIAALDVAEDGAALRGGTEALTVTSLAWIDSLGEAITLDAQTRDAVLSGLGESELRDQRGLACSILVRNLNLTFLPGSPSKLRAPLMPHVLHLVRQAPSQIMQSADLLLRTRAAQGLTTLGDYGGSLALLTEVQAKVMAPGPAAYDLLVTEDYLLEFAHVLIDTGQPDRIDDLLPAAETILAGFPTGDEHERDIVTFIRMQIGAVRGEVLEARGRHNDALALLLPALEYFAHHPRGGGNVGRTLEVVVKSLMSSGSVEEAVALLPQLASRLEGTSSALEAKARVELYLGIALIRSAGNMYPGKMLQLMSAETHLMKALNAANSLPDPSEVAASCNVNLGWLMTRAKEFRGVSSPLEAIKYLRKAIDIRTRLFGAATPRLKVAYYYLGMSLIETGELDEAETSLNRVLAGNPEKGLASDALTQLAKLYTARGDTEKLAEVRSRKDALNAGAARN